MHKRNEQKRKITKYDKSVDDYVIFGELYDWTEGELHIEDDQRLSQLRPAFGLLTPVFASGKLKYLPSYCRFHSHCCRSETLDSHRPER